MAESPEDRTELQPPAEPASATRKAPYALLAAAGVGVATVCAAVASFAVASTGEAQHPGNDVPPLVTQANNTQQSATVLSGSVTATLDTSSSAETSPDPTSSANSPTRAQNPGNNGGNQQPNQPGQPNNPGNPGGGGGGQPPGGGGGGEPTTTQTTTTRTSTTPPVTTTTTTTSSSVPPQPGGNP